MAETESFQTHPTRILLAPYACASASSRGRQVDEEQSAERTAYQRDRDRIIHAGNREKAILKAWAEAVKPADTFKWETKMEDNLLV